MGRIGEFCCPHAIILRHIEVQLQKGADLGFSYRSGRPIAEIIGERLPWTLLITLGSLVIASVIGAYYYIRIVYLMYFGEPREGLDGSMPFLPYAGLMASAAIMVLGVINLFGIEAPAAAAAEMLLR